MNARSERRSFTAEGRTVATIAKITERIGRRESTWKHEARESTGPTTCGLQKAKHAGRARKMRKFNSTNGRASLGTTSRASRDVAANEVKKPK